MVVLSFLSLVRENPASVADWTTTLIALAIFLPFDYGAAQMLE